MGLHINVLLESEVIIIQQLMIEVEEVQMVVEDHLVSIIMILELLVLVQHFSMHHQVLIVIIQCFQRVF